MVDDVVERATLVGEPEGLVVVRCRGVDTNGKQCTRTRLVGREKLYRLPENKHYCHRHSAVSRQTTRPGTLMRRKRPKPWRPSRVAGLVVMFIVAAGLTLAGIENHTLWLCLLGLVVLSLASLGACVVVVETVLQSLWIRHITDTVSQHTVGLGPTVVVYTDKVDIDHEDHSPDTVASIA